MNALLLSMLLTPGQAPAEPPAEYHHDFRGKPPPAELEPVGGDLDSFFRSEPEGLRITIPADYQHPWGGVGLRSRFPLRGDFEVTVAFEILRADVPDQGFGTGVAMRIQKVGSPAAVSICRLVRAGGKQLVWTDRAVEGPDGKPKFTGSGAPWTDNKGRLRLKREGPILYCLYAAGTEGDEFTELKKVDFGPEEVAHVRVSGVTAQQPCRLEARLIDLRIRGGGVPAATGLPAVAAEPAGPPRNATLWLVLGLAVLGAAVALWLALRRGKSPSQAAIEVTEENLSVHCPACQTRLRLPAHAVGKKAKCPKCASFFVAQAEPAN